MEALIVDDEALIREGLAEQLDWPALGFDSILTAENGAEALALIDISAPDLILTDIRMPFLTGLELAEKLRDNSNDVCIIIISGHEEFDYARSAMKLSVFDYILKPISLEEIYEVIKKAKKWIDNRSKRDEDRYFKVIGWNHNPGEDLSAMQERIISEHNSNKDIIDDCDVSDLQRILTDGSIAEIQAEYKRLKARFLEKKNCHLIILQIACSNIFFSFKSDLEANGGDLKAIFENPTDVFHSIMNGESINRMFDALDPVIDRMLDYREDLTSRESMKEVSAAERYIKKNFTDFSLDLNSVAGHINMNPCYFSTVFRKKTGVNFITYLTSLRIEKAMSLLKNTDMKTYEISYEAGYENPSYFSTVFKKMTGMTPKDYKKQWSG